MSQQTSPATGQYTDNGTPHSFSTVTPFIAVGDPDSAVEFYTSIFGARVLGCTRMGGQIVHAELGFANGRLQLGAATPDYGLRAPDPNDDTVTGSFGIYCPDVDATVERAVGAGAVLREEVVTFVSGDRYGSIRDPFGIRWSVMTRVEDISDEESDRRVQEWAASQG